MTDKIIALDLETTGLDPENDQILELGLAVFEIVDHEIPKEPSAKLSIVVSSVETRDWALEALKADNPTFVQKMHRDNGLAQDIAVAEPFFDYSIVVESLAQAEELAIQFMTIHGVIGLPMTGSSLSALDKPFLKRYMSALHDSFHYRVIDTSSVLEFLKLVSPQISDLVLSDTEAAHRAVQDCEVSVSFLRRIQYVAQLADGTTTYWNRELLRKLAD